MADNKHDVKEAPKDKQFDLLVHVRDPKNHRVVKTNPYQYHVSPTGNFYVRDGQKYYPNGELMVEVASGPSPADNEAILKKVEVIENMKGPRIPESPVQEQAKVKAEITALEQDRVRKESMSADELKKANEQAKDALKNEEALAEAKLKLEAAEAAASVKASEKILVTEGKLKAEKKD